MKKLVIIRHAKSDWADPLLADHARPLAERGFRDAPRMAQRLKKKGIFPDAILTSDARRALSTALLTAENLKLEKDDIQVSNKLYEASSAEILSEIKKVSDEIETLFVFGHNPGLNNLIADFGGEIDNLPTAGQFGFIFESDSWNEIAARNAKVWFFDYPKAK